MHFRPRRNSKPGPQRPSNSKPCWINSEKESPACLYREMAWHCRTCPKTGVSFAPSTSVGSPNGRVTQRVLSHNTGNYIVSSMANMHDAPIFWEQCDTALWTGLCHSKATAAPTWILPDPSCSRQYSTRKGASYTTIRLWICDLEWESAGSESDWRASVHTSSQYWHVWIFIQMQFSVIWLCPECIQLLEKWNLDGKAWLWRISALCVESLTGFDLSCVSCMPARP